MVADGNNVVITNNTVLRHGTCGVRIQGDLNGNGTVAQNQARYNGVGLCLAGLGHTVSLNVVSGSSSNGITVSATSSVFNRNSSKGNAGFGIADSSQGGGTSGTANTYNRNICTGNGAGASDPAGLCK